MSILLLSALQAVPSHANPLTWCRARYGQVFGGRSPKPVALTVGETTSRQQVIDEALAEIPAAGPGELAFSERREAVLKALGAELSEEKRLFSKLSPEERKEIAVSILTEVDAHANHVANRAEAASRIEGAGQALVSDRRLSEKSWGLSEKKTQEIFLDVFHAMLSAEGVRHSTLSPAEKSRWQDRVTKEVVARAQAVRDAILRANAASGAGEKLPLGPMAELVLAVVHHEVTTHSVSFAALTGEEGVKLADAAVAEVLSRIGPIEKALAAGIRQTSSPWNWQLRATRTSLQARLLEALHAELAKRGVAFSNLSRKVREATAETLVASALAPYQSRPTLLTTSIGLGVPIAFAYAGGMVMSDAVRPAWYIFTGILGGPFTFGVTYWLNGKMKPFFSVSPKTALVAVAHTPVERETERIGTQGRKEGASDSPVRHAMEGIGAASTGLSDPFKDGRNITKDSEINPRDSMNDAAWRIRDETDARKTLAAAVLYQAETFPEVPINSLLSFLLHMKVKERFGNVDAYASVQGNIRSLAKETGISPDEALVRLERMIRPDLWTNAPAVQKADSEQADAELTKLLARASGTRKSADAVAKEAAWAALFYERHYPGTPLSDATTFEFYMRTKDRLAKPGVYERAVALVEKEAPALGISPILVRQRLDAILRADLRHP